MIMSTDRLISHLEAVLYCQAPPMRRVNDDPDVWRTRWMGDLATRMVPYDMFAARDTGAKDYFAVVLGADSGDRAGLGARLTATTVLLHIGTCVSDHP